MNNALLSLVGATIICAMVSERAIAAPSWQETTAAIYQKLEPRQPRDLVARDLSAPWGGNAAKIRRRFHSSC